MRDQTYSGPEPGLRRNRQHGRATLKWSDLLTEHAVLTGVGKWWYTKGAKRRWDDNQSVGLRGAGTLTQGIYRPCQLRDGDEPSTYCQSLPQ